MMAAPFAATSLNLPDLRKKFKSLYDKVYYGDVLPPVGSQQLSYARMLELLKDKQVKRITLMSDGQIALVEVRSSCCSVVGCSHENAAHASAIIEVVAASLTTVSGAFRYPLTGGHRITARRNMIEEIQSAFLSGAPVDRELFCTRASVVGAVCRQFVPIQS